MPDQTDALRRIVADCLLPGAAMPGDHDGLYGRVDPVQMDARLQQLWRTLPCRPIQMNDPFDSWNIPSPMRSLQLLAPFWPAAEVSRRTEALAFDNPTIDSLAASIRRETYILSHHPGHEARFPAFAASRAGLILTMVVLGPAGVFAVLIPVAVGFADHACRSCVEARMIDAGFGALTGLVVGAIMLPILLLPAVFAVLRNRISPRPNKGDAAK